MGSSRGGPGRQPRTLPPLGLLAPLVRADLGGRVAARRAGCRETTTVSMRIHARCERHATHSCAGGGTSACCSDGTGCASSCCWTRVSRVSDATCVRLSPSQHLHRQRRLLLRRSPRAPAASSLCAPIANIPALHRCFPLSCRRQHAHVSHSPAQLGSMRGRVADSKRADDSQRRAAERRSAAATRGDAARLAWLCCLAALLEGPRRLHLGAQAARLAATMARRA